MSIKSRFERYKSLKAGLRYAVSGIKLNQLLAMDIGMLCFKLHVITIPEIIKNFVKAMPARRLRTVFEENELVFTSYFLGRKDYEEQARLTIGYLEPLYVVPALELANEHHFSIRNILKSLVVINKSYRRDFSFRERAYLASELCFILNTLESLERNFAGLDLSKKRYLAFNSSIGPEAILCQFLNARGGKTFSLSHGMSYVAYKRETPLDAIAGENVTASTVLVWGDASKRDLINNFAFPAERVRVAGNLKYPAVTINISQSFKAGIILLGRKIYNEGNVSILKVASKLASADGINFKVKLHPSLSTEYYQEICDKYGLELLDNNTSVMDYFKTGLFDFAIVNNSTAYYEAMYHGMICFRYAPDANEDFIGLNDEFEDEWGLRQQIQQYVSWNKEELNAKVEQLLRDTIGMGINNYRDIIKSDK